jgi:hypothetical protein
VADCVRAAACSNLLAGSPYRIKAGLAASESPSRRVVVTVRTATCTVILHRLIATDLAWVAVSVTVWVYPRSCRWLFSRHRLRLLQGLDKRSRAVVVPEYAFAYFLSPTSSSASLHLCDRTLLKPEAASGPRVGAWPSSNHLNASTRLDRNWGRLTYSDFRILLLHRLQRLVLLASKGHLPGNGRRLGGCLEPLPAGPFHHAHILGAQPDISRVREKS